MFYILRGILPLRQRSTQGYQPGMEPAGGISSAWLVRTSNLVRLFTCMYITAQSTHCLAARHEDRGDRSKNGKHARRREDKYLQLHHSGCRLLHLSQTLSLHAMKQKQGRHRQRSKFPKASQGADIARRKSLPFESVEIRTTPAGACCYVDTISAMLHRWGLWNIG